VPVPHVVLDANVLIPAGVRDLLVRAAEQGLCQVRWSDEILTEVVRHLPNFIHVEGNDAEEIAQLKRQKAEYVVAAMQRAFPDALITDYRQHIPTMTNNEQDRHVAAAAYTAGADIVTCNTKHFPDIALAPFRIRAHHPDAFLMQLFAADPEAMTNIIHEIARTLTRPSRTTKQLLDGRDRFQSRDDIDFAYRCRDQGHSLLRSGQGAHWQPLRGRRQDRRLGIAPCGAMPPSPIGGETSVTGV
jgi:predicted nucleic acid-binding protein